MQDLYQIDTKECAPVIELDLMPCRERGIRLFMKREDLLHGEISGNKFRKLKYNLRYAREQGYSTVLSFGGAYSNHIHALARAGQLTGLNTIGIIRGEAEYATNPTLRDAQAWGMQLQFIDRQTYKFRNQALWLAQLQAQYPDAYIIPEGGSNLLALQGVAEIWHDLDETYDYIVTAAGSGGTAAGLITGAPDQTQVVVVPVLKGNFLPQAINGLLQQEPARHDYICLDDYHFGGYAKSDETLLKFISDFEQQTTIPLDPVYTAKMVYAVLAEVEKGRFKPGARVIMLHTGGLQGRYERLSAN